VSEFALSVASGIRVGNIFKAARRIRILGKRPMTILYATCVRVRLLQRILSAPRVIDELGGEKRLKENKLSDRRRERAQLRLELF